MDSGNSGNSLQSSSGDEEYNSRATTHINNPPPPPPLHFGSISNPPSSSSSAMFDPFANYFNPISRSANSLFAPPQSCPPPAATDQINMLASASSSPFNFLFAPLPSPSPPPSLGPPILPENTGSSSATNTPRGGVVGSDQNQTTHVIRNPKKRSRASRRAPTTVLTTDTTNFRAMVQEFTGIPAPPFSAASSFPRARFDLYGTSSNQPPYLLRPFAQKVQPQTPSFLASSDQLSGGLLKQQQQPPPPQNSSFLDINPNPNPNPILTSLFQSNNINPSKTSFTDDFWLGHHQGGGPPPSFAGCLPSLIASDQNNPMINNWGNGNAANGKPNFSSASSGFNQGDKVPLSDTNGGGGGGTEGMMESWICSSELK